MKIDFTPYMSEAKASLPFLSSCFRRRGFNLVNALAFGNEVLTSFIIGKDKSLLPS
ncbi:MAG: hypothetical protein RBR61_02115 [Sulfurimonas sp.]|nr:hypothetical protein [Sulfurimonas sp.]